MGYINYNDENYDMYEAMQDNIANASTKRPGLHQAKHKSKKGSMKTKGTKASNAFRQQKESDTLQKMAARVQL